jgi:hypothetical protein
MRLLNRVERVSLPLRDGRLLEATVRLRGIDARAAGQGFAMEDRTPESITVRGPAGEQSARFQRERAGPPPIAFVALPAAGWLMVRLLAPKGR